MMLRVSTSRGDYHHGDLAAALERAAMQLLDEKPAAQISLREVARAADVSHNAPYHHFADRRGLLKTLAERSMAGLVEAVLAAVAAATGDEDRLRAAAEAYIRFASERPHAFEAIYDPTVCVPGAPTATMAPLIDELEGLLARLATDGGLGEPTDPVALWGLMHGLATLAAAGHLEREAAVAAARGAIDRLLAAH